MPDPLLSNHLTAVSLHPAYMYWGNLLALLATLQAILCSKSNMQICSKCIECIMKTQKNGKKCIWPFQSSISFNWKESFGEAGEG
jgi:hypothetical protein